MSCYRRLNAGSTVFFTVVTFRRRPILCDVAVRSALRQAIQQVRATRPFDIDAWVLLPDHLHCIWTLPVDDHDFSFRWRSIKQRVAIACGQAYADPALSPLTRRRQRESTIWQRRFWEHTIRSEDDYHRHFDYIHFNPMRHGHVPGVADWPYSTFHRHVRDGIYSPDWCGAPEIADLDFE